MRKSFRAAAPFSGRPHIALVLPGLRAGGSEHIVSLLCNHFSRLGWAVSLFAFEERGDAPYYPHDPGVRIRQLGHPAGRLPLFRSLANVRDRILTLRGALEEDRPDLVISFLTRTNVVSVLAARPLGIPVIVSERNNPSQQRPGFAWSALRRHAYGRAHGLITMTQGAMDQFPASMRRRQWVIPNPTYAPIEPDPGRVAGKRIVAVGRLVPQKGFDLLLDAFARVSERMPGWSLTIWGEGPERAKLEAQRDALGLRKRVALPGVTKEHGGWLREADIFVLSSRFEGWGIVIGEAMAAGIPTIAFDCCWGPGEMIANGVGGLLVPDGDVPALGEAMAALCNDPARRAQLSQGARIASQRFTTDAVLRQWEDVVAEALVLERPSAGKPTLAAA
ncbi:glycosyltransferase family 4 protein [Sphingobium cloacae]|uniref:Amylovoran biosynthesis protein AmsD n=1 Tax=Sphingobium cloacae TaxID=120107 RepID=A0A1E1F539_9SPHN|nr:glycosyltransferase family 4 protein [Sphingobium cloacae]BAV65633.1 amylovoran biosynthesis protein AmsD [Sphingobium cloacae]